MDSVIVGIGEVLWDMLPEGKQIGGAPANFAYHVSRFGLDSMVISAIGNDMPGNEVIEIFREKNLPFSLQRVDYPTGTVLVHLDEHGVPKYEIKEAAAWDHIPYTDELSRLAARTRAVCFGSLAQRSQESRDTIMRFLDDMTQKGALKIFDINLRQHYYTRDIISESLKKCTILKINDEELDILAHIYNYTDKDFRQVCLRVLDDFSLDMIILTMGIRGSYVFTPDSFSFLDTPRMTIVDTVGAGDSFTGAFCSALLKGHSIEEAHHFAVDVSAHVCGCHGAMPDIPDSLINRI